MTDQGLGDLGREASPPSGSRQCVGDLKFNRAFNIDIPETGAPDEGSILGLERPQTKAMIGPMADVRFQIGGRRLESPDSPKEPRHFGIKMKVHQIG